MQEISSLSELRSQLQQWRQAQQSIAFVPTMGNLHAGHRYLVERALSMAQRVIVSIFVNPLQFGAGEDFQSYPRTLEADRNQLKPLGTHLLFMPTAQNIYPRGLDATTQIEVPQLSQILCGAYRPGHFKGVATVVNILFNLIQPDVALFGEKDFQQLLVIKRMVADLHLPIEIIGIPTVRETDGLAMSSRNSYLTPAQRIQAPLLFQTLNQIKIQIAKGVRNFTDLENQAFQTLTAAGFQPDYIAVRRQEDLELPTPTDNSLRILGAARLGAARLIDNLSA